MLLAILMLLLVAVLSVSLKWALDDRDRWRDSAQKSAELLLRDIGIMLRLDLELRELRKMNEFLDDENYGLRLELARERGEEMFPEDPAQYALDVLEESPVRFAQPDENEASVG